MKEDVLRDFLNRLVHAIQQTPDGFSETVIRQIERQVRNDWAGERPFIAKEPDREKRREVVMGELKRGTPVADISEKTGLSRRRIYELYRQKQTHD